MNKNEIKSTTTKKRLCDAYVALLKDKNVSKITIKEITDKAGYNRGTFYIYYRDVYDMHDKIKKGLISSTRNKIRQVLESNKTLEFEIILQTVINIFSANEKYFIAFITNDNTFPYDIKKTMGPLLKEIFKKDLNNKNIDYIIEYHLSSIFGVINLWISQNKNISSEELFNLLKEIITKGVFNVMKEI